MRGLGCLLIWSNDVFFGMGKSNLRYMTHCGFQPGVSFAIFPLDGKPIVFMGALHTNIPYHACIAAQNWVDDVRPTPRWKA